MRDDLLDAQESINWAVANFEGLDERFDDWIRSNVRVEVKKLDSNAASDVLVAIEKEPLPRRFNVEVGAYINAIRSALDLLATALAYRYGIAKPDDAYFPMATGIAAFQAGSYKGAKFVKGMPAAQRALIESLKPYQGGNELLWSLHHLDIVRKHKRLLVVVLAPARLRIDGIARSDFTPIATGWLRANDETILGLIRKGAAEPEVELTAAITVDEATLSGIHVPIIATLREFASAAQSVIALFDTP